MLENDYQPSITIITYHIKTISIMQFSVFNISKMNGEKVIISGVEVDEQNVVSDGWIVYNNELIPFTGGLLATGIVVQETVTQATFLDGSVNDAYFTKTAFFGSPATFNFSDLVRLTSLKQTWLPGDVKEVDCDAAYIAANFDVTGLGINERKGWAICNGQNGTRDRGGRVSVGYTTLTIDPNDNVWDVVYNTIGATGGEKKHTLTIPEMPAHTHTFNGSGDKNPDDSNVNGYAPMRNNNDLPGTYTGHMNSTGGGGAHENRQPFIVTLFIQKL